MAKRTKDITPDFNWNAINQAFENHRNHVVNQEIEALRYVGEQFVTQARNKAGEGRAYRDRTGNLRHSIGFAIIEDGKIIELNIDSGSEEGPAKAREVANKMANEYNRGLVLVGFAGMEYAAAVEAKGYDVITGSTPSVQNLLSELVQNL